MGVDWSGIGVDCVYVLSEWVEVVGIISTFFEKSGAKNWKITHKSAIYLRCS